MHKLSGFKRGDTLIEVMLSVAIFGMVTVGSIQLMNRGVATAQGNLETSMARNEIDTQAEALRFIHKAYTTNRSNNSNPYTILWKQITTRAVSFNNLPDDFFSSYNGGSCTNNSGGYSDSIIMNGKSFIINPRYFNNLPTHDSDYTTQTGTNVLSIYSATGGNLTPAETYPRLIYTDESTSSLSDQAIANEKNQRFATAEGIWVTAVRSDATTSGSPNYYDFYIRTCWSNISGNSSTTISSIVRLYNPDIAPAAEIAGGGGNPVSPADPGGGGGYDPSPDPTPTPDPVTPTPSEPEQEPENPEICFGDSCFPDSNVYLAYVFTFSDVYSQLADTYKQASASNYGISIASPYGTSCFYLDDPDTNIIRSAADAASHSCERTTSHYTSGGTLNTSLHGQKTISILFQLTSDFFPTACMYGNGSDYCFYYDKYLEASLFDADTEHNSYVLYEPTSPTDPVALSITNSPQRAKFYFPRDISYCAVALTNGPESNLSCNNLGSYQYYTDRSEYGNFEYSYTRGVYFRNSPSQTPKYRYMKVNESANLLSADSQYDYCGTSYDSCPSTRKKVDVSKYPVYYTYAHAGDPGGVYNPSGFVISF